MLEMLQVQSQQLQLSIASSEEALEALKIIYDEESKDIRQELSIAKRLLKTNQSSILALGGEVDEQSDISDEQSTDAEA